jgi:hypothetical protein
MRLVHNYYVDFLKSLKKFIENIYGDAQVFTDHGITSVGGFRNFEFNYASKSLLHYKLYQQVGFEFPTCIINLTDIQTDNSQPFRYNYGIYTEDLAQTVSINKNTNELIKVDFRWVTLSISIKMNFETGADVLNYYDRLNNLPINFMFYSYKYNSFLDGTSILQTDLDDNSTTLDTILSDYSDIYYKMEPTTSNLRYWFSYNTEPIFKINSKQKNIDSDNNNYSIDLNLEVQLKIPAVMAKINSRNNMIIKNIEIIIANTFNIDNPILIEEPQIYIDNKNQLSKIFIMEKSDFSFSMDTDGINWIELKIPEVHLNQIINKFVSLYLCSDVTNPAPLLFHKRFGLINLSVLENLEQTNIIIKDGYIIFRFLANTDEELFNIYTNIDVFSDLRLLVFNNPV